METRRRLIFSLLRLYCAEGNCIPHFYQRAYKTTVLISPCGRSLDIIKVIKINIPYGLIITAITAFAVSCASFENNRSSDFETYEEFFRVQDRKPLTDI